LVQLVAIQLLVVCLRVVLEQTVQDKLAAQAEQVRHHHYYAPRVLLLAVLVVMEQELVRLAVAVAAQVQCTAKAVRAVATQVVMGKAAVVVAGLEEMVEIFPVLVLLVQVQAVVEQVSATMAVMDHLHLATAQVAVVAQLRRVTALQTQGQ
jgi:hypothetical protein